MNALTRSCDDVSREFGKLLADDFYKFFQEWNKNKYLVYNFRGRRLSVYFLTERKLELISFAIDFEVQVKLLLLVEKTKHVVRRDTIS